MKFIFADSLDYVDPGYDFLRDRNAEGRRPYWDDQFPHEALGYAPYQGMLVSRAIVGGGPASGISGKYTDAQAMRFRRVGAREFLRLSEPKYASLDIFGDCGAFSYHNEDVPPYTPEDTAEFYDDSRFTHGCSSDHIIFDFIDGLSGMSGGSQENIRRFDITQANAEAFFKATRHMSNRFCPLGVIQGWSPSSMAEAARRLVAMGYDYLALGGTVPLKAPQIMQCIIAIREAIPSNTRLHVLGFAKADNISDFIGKGITSFDTTSPLIRAFKDAKSNYYLPGTGGALNYYTAIRVPQAIENPKLMNLAKRGILHQEDLQRMEADALATLRRYDKGLVDLEETLETVLAYAVPATIGDLVQNLPGLQKISDLRARYERTLLDRPWTKCDCPVCKETSIEVMLFRASNRNKRRGIHNLYVYANHLNKLKEQSAHEVV